ncbi:MAG: type II restriction endonuclease [candidate division WOR-3 bacterium]
MSRVPGNSVARAEGDFKPLLERYFADFFRVVETREHTWTVKGFIDVYRNIYTISLDTKVVSKVIELMVFPVIVRFCHEHGYDMVLSAHQNHYPDISFVHRKSKTRLALDLKSTYRIGPDRVNGMTLGAFTGYFRNRQSAKNVTFPYGSYARHFVLGVIYTRADAHNAGLRLEELGYTLSGSAHSALMRFVSGPSEETFGRLARVLHIPERKFPAVRRAVESVLIDERKKYRLSALKRIPSVVRDFDFFLQEKWRVATDRPGSGNTKNIGSTTSVAELKNGTGPFTKYPKGDKLFDDYWTYYLARDMARAAELKKPPYHNLKTYFEYKKS